MFLVYSKPLVINAVSIGSGYYIISESGGRRREYPVQNSSADQSIITIIQQSGDLESVAKVLSLRWGGLIDF